jgi:stringent starvation protein B
MSEISTKPYFLRALYEWCTDNGYTPYIAVKVFGAARVPMEFVRNGDIVLNISFGATSSLKMDNESISFKARFGGVSRDIYVPIENVQAIYASENGQGMAFEVNPVAQQAVSAETTTTTNEKPSLGLASSKETSASEERTDATSQAAETPKKSQKPSLKIIK